MLTPYHIMNRRVGSIGITRRQQNGADLAAVDDAGSRRRDYRSDKRIGPLCQ